MAFLRFDGVIIIEPDGEKCPIRRLPLSMRADRLDPQDSPAEEVNFSKFVKQP